MRCNAIKQELESSIQLYKDSVKHSRTVEKQIQVSHLLLDSELILLECVLIATKSCWVLALNQPTYPVLGKKLGSA